MSIAQPPDAQLATGSAKAAAPRLGAGEFLLIAISGLLLLIPFGALSGAIWLILTGSRRELLLAAVLLVIAYALRPRLGSLRRLMRGHYRLDPDRAPALHSLVAQVAAAGQAPRPHRILLDDNWNAGATTIGLRRRRVLILGIPYLVSLTKQELVAVIGHELGHLKYQDSLRRVLTHPARTQIGALARAFRGPDVSHDETLQVDIYMIIWKLVGAPISWLLWMVHLGLNIIDARQSRRAELRADLLAARVAGTTASAASLDSVAMTRLMDKMIDGSSPGGSAMQRWRQRIAHVRERAQPDIPRLRQLSIRTDTSLFSSHPPAGRRHQFVSRAGYQPATLAVSDVEAARLDAEIAPYAEALRKTLAGA